MVKSVGRSTPGNALVAICMGDKRDRIVTTHISVRTAAIAAAM